MTAASMGRETRGYRARPLWQELRPLYLGKDRLPPVVALAAYFDESRNFRERNEHDYGIVAVAGYMAPVEMWDESFTPAWRRVLDAAPHPIREFKAADCRHGKGEFAKWSRSDRNDLTRDLVSVIGDPAHALVGFGAAVLMQEVVFTSRMKQRDRERTAYYWCTSRILGDAITRSEQFLGEDHLQCVFDEEKDLGAQAQEGFEVIRDQFPHIRTRVRRPHFAHSHELPPLQAADLLAYETYKELRNRKDDRAPSKALARLVAGRPHQAYYMPLPFILACDVLREQGVELPQIGAPLIYHSAAREQICRV